MLGTKERSELLVLPTAQLYSVSTSTAVVYTDTHTHTHACTHACTRTTHAHTHAYKYTVHSGLLLQ